MQTLVVSLPPGFRLRPARDDDAHAIAAFANDEAEKVIGAPVISPQWLLRHWTAPSVNRDHDVAVVEASDGRPCGYLSVRADLPYARVLALGIVALPYRAVDSAARSWPRTSAGRNDSSPSPIRGCRSSFIAVRSPMSRASVDS